MQSRFPYKEENVSVILANNANRKKMALLGPLKTEEKYIGLHAYMMNTYT
jgi:hypothetical protein